MYHMLKHYENILPTRRVYVFRLIPKTDSDYFPLNINWLVFIMERPSFSLR